MLVKENLQDFVLFPHKRPQPDMLALESSRHQQSYGHHFSMDPNIHDPYPCLSLNSYDSFGSHASFSSAPGSYFDTPSFIVDAPPDMIKHEQYQQTPSGSPSIAPSRSTEHPPSTLSTASGQSVPSASSSAVGSPYSGAAHGVPYQDAWNEMNHGLGLVPTIVGNDSFVQDFVTSSMDSDIIFAHDKLPDHYVGEYANVSSLKSESIPFSASISQPAMCVSAPSLALSTSVEDSGMTIDTILDRANSAVTPPRPDSSPVSGRSNSTSPTIRGGQATRTSSKDQRGFRSPTTPASATPITHATYSPALTNRRHSLAQVIGATPSRNSPPFSPRMARSSVPSPRPESPKQVYAGHFQNPFFAQSSGNFVPPLESSCWFSL